MSGGVASGGLDWAQEMQDSGEAKQVTVSLKELHNREDLKQQILEQDADLYPDQVPINNAGDISVNTKDIFELRGADRPSLGRREPLVKGKRFNTILAAIDDYSDEQNPRLRCIGKHLGHDYDDEVLKAAASANDGHQNPRAVARPCDCSCCRRISGQRSRLAHGVLHHCCVWGILRHLPLFLRPRDLPSDFTSTQVQASAEGDGQRQPALQTR
jgi:hypothetical protein